MACSLGGCRAGRQLSTPAVRVHILQACLPLTPQPQPTAASRAGPQRRPAIRSSPSTTSSSGSAATSRSQNADFAIERGEFFSMLGPSGCGKTTTLRMIAGFEQPTTGRILLDGQGRLAGPALPPQRQHGVPALRAVPAHDRRPTTSPSGRAARRWRADETARRVERAARGRPAHARSPTGSRRSSPAASSSGSRWRARSSTTRARCCSTSRSARSTSSCARRCRSSSSASSARSASRSST